MNSWIIMNTRFFSDYAQLYGSQSVWYPHIIVWAKLSSGLKFDVTIDLRWPWLISFSIVVSYFSNILVHFHKVRSQSEQVSPWPDLWQWRFDDLTNVNLHFIRQSYTHPPDFWSVGPTIWSKQGGQTSHTHTHTQSFMRQGSLLFG